MTPESRAARRDDAAALARIIDLAGEGLPLHLWQQSCDPGQDPWQIGASRAARDTGGFSWRNARVIEIGGQVAAGMIGYRIGHEPEPLYDLPPILRPLQALENRALGSYYINAIATLPDHRGRGLARVLMQEAERLAAGAGTLSLIVADVNLPAQRLYAGLGYAERAREAVVTNGWTSAARHWILMVKSVAAPR